MRRTRHTDVVEFFHLFYLSEISLPLTFQLFWNPPPNQPIAWSKGHGA
jgi:hypothetical protein